MSFGQLLYSRRQEGLLFARASQIAHGLIAVELTVANNTPISFGSPSPFAPSREGGIILESACRRVF